MNQNRRSLVVGIGASDSGLPLVALAQGKARVLPLNAQPPATSKAEFCLKYANNLPISHVLSVRAREMAAVIKAESKGRVELQIFPNNELGNDTEMLRKLKEGKIDYFILSGLILSSSVPAAAIGDNGFRQITSFARAINGAEDLSGMKIRVPMSPMWTSMFKSLEASPVGINFGEVYPALQNKTVESQETPPGSHRCGKALRGAEVLLDDAPHVGWDLVLGQQGELGKAT